MRRAATRRDSREGMTMHEYSIVHALIAQIETHARAQHAVSVRHVFVRIGRAAGVDVSLFRTAYDVCRPSTICAAAPLAVEEVPERWTCPSGHGDLTPGRPLVCATCGCPARLVSGDDIILERLELEVL